MVRHRHHEQQQHHGRRARPQRAAHAAGMRLQRRVAGHAAQAARPRDHQAGDDAPRRQQHADEEVAAGHKHRDAEQHEHAVCERQRRIDDEPAPFTAGAGRRLGLVLAEHMPAQQVAPVLVGALAQVGAFDGIGKDVVAVVAQQRVGVEQQRRQAGQHDDVERQRAHEARLERQPQVERQRGDEQLGEHAGRAHQHAWPAALEGGRAAGVDIRHREEHQQHHAHLVHFTAEALGRQAVADLVRRLQQREQQRQQQQVVDRQHALAEVAGQLTPVAGRQQQRRQHHRQPQHQARQAAQRAGGRHHPAQPGVGVDQRKAQRHRVGKALQQLAAALLAATLEQLGQVGRHVALDQVGRIQPAEQRDQLVLAGRALVHARGQGVPHVLQAALAVELADHPVAAGVETVVLAGHAVFDHVPDLAAVDMAVDPHMAAQPGPQRGHAVPVGAEQGVAQGARAVGRRGGGHGGGGVQGVHCHHADRTQSVKRWVHTHSRLRSPTTTLATPSMLGRSAVPAAVPANWASARK